jgi:hypothetical protein
MITINYRMYAQIRIGDHLIVTLKEREALLGAFANLWRSTISVFISVCPSVRPSVRMEQLGSYPTDFCKIPHMNIFRNSFEKIQVSFKSYKTKGTLLQDKCIFMISLSLSLSVRLRMRNISDRSCRGNQNTHLMFNTFFFSKIVSFMR